ncbi:MAG: Abi-alpha family protein [Methanothrix sp.]|nr:Abi-alpha family protein [Methanothrix sp.]
MADIMGIGEALNSKVAEKAYDDILSKPAKQAGELLEDSVQALRLALFPVQVAASLQEKFERMWLRAINAVPTERRISLQPQTIPSLLQMVGPIYERVKYMDENSVLYELFEELLARSIDNKRNPEAQPSFIHIISQLSRDEAIILLELRNNDFDLNISFGIEHETSRIIDKKIEFCNFPSEKLYFPEIIEMYFDHMDKLGLIGQPKIEEKLIRDGSLHHIGIKRCFKIHLSDFGDFFVNACVPENGFRNK